MDLSFELIELKIKFNEIKFKYDSLLEKLEKKRISKEQRKIIKMFHPVRLDDPTKKYNYDDMDLSEY
jgi:hypothetical protein